MEEDLLKQASGTSGSSSGSTASGDQDNKQDNNDNASARKPQDAPPQVAANANANNNDNGNKTGSENASDQAKGMALADKKPEQQKSPDELKAEQVAEALKSTIARFQITNSTVIANLEKEFYTPGVQLTQSFMEKQVQNIDPVNFAMTKFREMVGGSMSNVASTQIAQLSPNSVGIQQQQQGRAVSPMA